MSKKLYIGNLPFNCTDQQIRDAFSEYGTVESVALVTDRETGRSRGFGFVEMDPAGAEAAIANLDGKDFGGRNLRVNAAHEQGPSGGGRGGGGGARPGGRPGGGRPEGGGRSAGGGGGGGRDRGPRH